MGPEDRLAQLLAALDRLPSGARRALTMLLPVALLAALLASLLLAPHTRHHEAKPAGERTRPAAQRVRPAPGRRRRGGRIRHRRSAARRGAM